MTGVIEIQYLLPFPAVLTSPISPPCSSVSSRDINNPNPLPPYSTCVRGLAWANRRNRRVFSSYVKPLPVSFTAKYKKTCSPSPHSGSSVKSLFVSEPLDGNHSISTPSPVGGFWTDAARLTVMIRSDSDLVNLIACRIFSYGQGIAIFRTLRL